MTEENRWRLVGVILIAAGGAILKFFEGRM